MSDFPKAILYFGIVFAAGFALAFVRLPFLVPRYGVRIAELIEMPVMLFVIGIASHWLYRRNSSVSATRLLWIGCIALLLMVVAEFGLALATSDLSLIGYISSKDPVSGTAYLVSLVIFALAPWLWSLKSRV